MPRSPGTRRPRDLRLPALAYGDHYVSVDYGPHGERVQVRDQAHFVAYQLHREACFENRGPNPKVEVLPEARPQ